VQIYVFSRLVKAFCSVLHPNLEKKSVTN